MNFRGANAYRSTQLTLAPPPRLLLEVFRNLAEALRRAQAFLVVGDLTGKATAIDQSLALLGELETALDPAAAPDLCANLAGLYRFCSERVLQASVELTLEPLQEVEQVLQPVREAFQAIIDASDAPVVSAAPQSEARGMEGASPHLDFAR